MKRLALMLAMCAPLAFAASGCKKNDKKTDTAPKTNPAPEKTGDDTAAKPDTDPAAADKAAADKAAADKAAEEKAKSDVADDKAKAPDTDTSGDSDSDGDGDSTGDSDSTSDDSDD